MFAIDRRDGDIIRGERRTEECPWLKKGQLDAGKISMLGMDKLVAVSERVIRENR